MRYYGVIIATGKSEVGTESLLAKYYTTTCRDIKAESRAFGYIFLINGWTAVYTL